jgi:hypothetical protein
MPVLFLKALECHRPHGVIPDVNVRISVSVDGGKEGVVKMGTMSARERKILGNSVQFLQRVKLRLLFRVDNQIGHSHTLTKETLPHKLNGRRGFHRGKRQFQGSSEKAGADYFLWYEVVPDGMTPAQFHRSALLPSISLRQFLGRTGRGVMTPHESTELRAKAIYRCSEVISVRDIISLHRRQDDETGDTVSLRLWIARHCNIWGEESVIPIEQLPVGPHYTLLPSVPNWRPVKDEQSRVQAGFATQSLLSHGDNLPTHMSRDWTFSIFPSPAFSYMLAYTPKTTSVSNEHSTDASAELSMVPKSHNEWETGSMPIEWRPEEGEYLTIFGRHIFDLGHLPMTTEIHPTHTIVREFTKGEKNFAIIGMGFSGGFPGVNAGELEARWKAEFGGFLDGLNVRNRRCWATNLKKHPLKIKLFPPDPPPKPTSTLGHKIDYWKLIRVKNSEIDNFLNHCKSTAEVGPRHQTFAEWFPDGLESRPVDCEPILVSRGDHFDLTIDLSRADDIPVAYQAMVQCFWKDG